MKYIIVTGGVVSGLGKGITISSIGRILKSSGLRVTSIKIDPYLNVDAGTMSPFEHGETFVLDDGGETDLDLGNYERFLDITLTGRHNITSGKIYKEVIRQERRGDYLGKTVQIVPHATDMVQTWLQEVAKISVDGTGLSPDVCLVEVGGTVGDIESMVFLEALRQFQFTVGRENLCLVHVSLVPVLGEQKTKPTQHSVKELRALGLSPDIIVCRSSELLLQSTKNKISTFCHVQPSHIISVHDVSNIYHVPLILVQQNIHTIIRDRLCLGERMAAKPDLRSWSNVAMTVDTCVEAAKGSVKGMVGGELRQLQIVLVGKYVGLQDSYLSVTKALTHSGIFLNLKIEVVWVEAADLEQETLTSEPLKHAAAWEQVRAANGVLIPGGFGVRGVQGMVLAARYARENKVPFLGVCLGMQVMVIEYARNVLNLDNAHSTEFNEATPHPVVVFMPEINQKEMGGTMRLGARATHITTHTSPTAPGPPPATKGLRAVSVGAGAGGKGTGGGSKRGRTLASEVYGFQDTNQSVVEVMERHRHRYEVNPDLVQSIEAAGLLFTGRDDAGVRMEIAELSRDTHPHYLGCQFHPEFKSRPTRPSPPFFAFASVAAGRAGVLGTAGQMWRDFDEDKRREIAYIYSPKSGLKRRTSSVSDADAGMSPAAMNLILPPAKAVRK